MPSRRLAVSGNMEKSKWLPVATGLLARAEYVAQIKAEAA